MRRFAGRCALIGLLCLSVATSRSSGAAPAVRIPLTGDLPPKLSEYGLFADAWRQIPAERVVPYDLNTPHFADYATLRRFVWMPEGTSIVYRDDAILDYPIGTALLLTVGYPSDEREPAGDQQLIETRVLIHREEGWVSGQYVWDTAGTEARLTVAGRRVRLARLGLDGQSFEQTVLVPNRNQCKMCHEVDGRFIPLGPRRIAYLNRNYRYQDGTENQLTRWTRLGYLTGTPADPERAPRFPVWNDPATGSLDRRARAYLDMNCSSCHRPGGLAYTSGLDLTYEQTNPTSYGVYKAPVAAGRGGRARFGIVPGAPDESILVHRVRSTDPGIRMPVVGRGVVHEEGVALLEQWVAQMSFPALAAAQNERDRVREAQRRAVADLWADRRAATETAADRP